MRLSTGRLLICGSSEMASGRRGDPRGIARRPQEGEKIRSAFGRTVFDVIQFCPVLPQRRSIQIVHQLAAMIRVPDEPPGAKIHDVIQGFQWNLADQDPTVASASTLPIASVSMALSPKQLSQYDSPPPAIIAARKREGNLLSSPDSARVFGIGAPGRRNLRPATHIFPISVN